MEEGEEKRGEGVNTTSMEGGNDLTKDFIGGVSRDDSPHIAGSVSLQKSPLSIFALSLQSPSKINQIALCLDCTASRAQAPAPADFPRPIVHTLSQPRAIVIYSSSSALCPLTLSPGWLGEWGLLGPAGAAPFLQPQGKE